MAKASVNRRRAGPGENDESAERWSDSGSQGIEGLCQIEAAGCAFSRAKLGHVGVGGDLQKRDAGGKNPESAEKEAIGGNHGGGIEEKRSEAHDR